MNDTHSKRTVYRTSGGNITLGLWLLLAPFILGYSELEQALWNDIVLGVLVFLLAIIRATVPLRLRGLSFTNFALGTWILLAPFVLGYSDYAAAPAFVEEGASGAIEQVNAGAAIWNDVIVGILIVALSGWSAAATRGKTGSARRNAGNARGHMRAD